MRLRLLIFLSLFVNPANSAGSSGGDAVASILSMPIATTFCPTLWPFGILTSLGVTGAGGATSSSTTLGISSSSSTTTTADLNRGNLPFSDTNVYEKLDDWQDDYEQGLRYRLIGVVKKFFLSEEDIENWDDYWAKRKEKKQQKKADKQEKKRAQKRKNKEEKPEVVCDLSKIELDNSEQESSYEQGETITVPCYEVLQ